MPPGLTSRARVGAAAARLALPYSGLTRANNYYELLDDAFRSLRVR
eukprot:COSAG06_NODE_13203_length_1283_cov_1.102196_1_plen_45_part_10